MTDLSGRVAVVVGGGRDLGAAIALALGEAGAAVALLGREACELTAVAALLRLQGCAVVGITADYAQPDAIALALADAREVLGPLQIVVDPIGVPAVAEAALPDMRDAEWGRIVVVTPGAAPPARIASAAGITRLTLAAGHAASTALATRIVALLRQE